MSIRATARAAARAAFTAGGDAIGVATICLGPNVGAYDPATDTAATAWRLVKETKALAYDDAEEQADGPELRTKAFVFLGEDLVTNDGEELKGEQDGLIDFDGLSFEILKSESDPTGTVWIFTTRQNGLAELRAVYAPIIPPPPPPPPP